MASTLLCLLSTATLGLAATLPQEGTYGEVHALQERPPAQGRVWVVDAGGGGDFTDLQPAIDAAASGDLILLRSDLVTSTGYEVAYEGLTIAGDGPQRTLRSPIGSSGPALAVRNLPAARAFVLRNVRFVHDLLDGFPFLELSDDAGTVWVEDCSFEYLAESAGTRGVPQEGIVAEDCDAVVLLRAAFEPAPAHRVEGFSMLFHVAGGAALIARSSTVHAFESSFLGHGGGRADTLAFVWGGHGGDGVRLEDGSFLSATACTLRGGNGGNAAPIGTACFFPGDGGTGLWVSSDSEAHTAASALLSSMGGEGLPGMCGSGASGPPAGPSGSMGLLDETSAALRTHAVASPAPAGGTTGFTATGPVGDLVLSLVGARPATDYLPLHLGAQLVAPPFDVVVEGTIPAGGVLAKSIAVPPLPPSLAFARQFRQALFVDSLGAGFLAGGSAVVILP